MSSRIMLSSDALTPGYHPMDSPLSIPVSLVTGFIALSSVSH